MRMSVGVFEGVGLRFLWGICVGFNLKKNLYWYGLHMSITRFYHSIEV